MKAVIIGCGRVGSSVAKQLAADGWEITCVDDDENALSRLGEWRGGFVVGHGMDLEVLDRAGVATAAGDLGPVGGLLRPGGYGGWLCWRQRGVGR